MAIGGAQMGEVIRGPWRRPNIPGVADLLSEEIARMTQALETLRELYRKREEPDMRASPGGRPE